MGNITKSKCHFLLLVLARSRAIGNCRKWKEKRSGKLPDRSTLKKGVIEVSDVLSFFRQSIKVNNKPCNLAVTIGWKFSLSCQGTKKSFPMDTWLVQRRWSLVVYTTAYVNKFKIAWLDGFFERSPKRAAFHTPYFRQFTGIGAAE